MRLRGWRKAAFYGICAVVLVVGTLGSFALARIHFRGSRAISSTTLFTYIIPPSFLSIPFFKLMADYDLLGLKISVVLAMITFASPYAVWILWAYGKTVWPSRCSTPSPP